MPNSRSSASCVAPLTGRLPGSRLQLYAGATARLPSRAAQGWTLCRVLNSDWRDYGGSGVDNGGEIAADHLPWQNCGYSAELNLPPLGVFFLKPIEG